MSMSEYMLSRRAKAMGQAPPPVPKEIKKIPIKSVKAKAMHKLYLKIVKEAAAISTECEVKLSPHCTNVMSGMQHKVKRSPKTMVDRKNLLRCCTNCNEWIELNPLKAIAAGVSGSKFTPDQQEETN